jgi:RNA polymerase sigma-70 factor (ECF subfamily)
VQSDPLHIFEVLAKQHEPMLLAYLSALVPDRALAEDVAQQTFLIAYRKIDQLDDPAAFPAWLRGIARREALAAIRRQAREFTVEPALIQQLDQAYRQMETGQPAESWEERFRHVEECFQELPETMQETCRLHYFEDRKAREIAEQLAINLNAVLKRLERARAALRECVEARLLRFPS